MEINKYSEMARKTAIYPNLGDNYTYPLLGLIEESAEVDEKIMLGINKEEIIKELGDVYWYLSSCSDELNLKLEDILNNPKESNLSLSLEGSKIAGYLKKLMRDDNGVLNEDKKIKIVDSLKKIAFLMNKYEKDYQVSQKIIMEKNIEKLYSRKERGTLKGSGDNR